MNVVTLPPLGNSSVNGAVRNQAGKLFDKLLGQRVRSVLVYQRPLVYHRPLVSPRHRISFINVPCAAPSDARVHTT
jgi:hypothetical protein